MNDADEERSARIRLMTKVGSALRKQRFANYFERGLVDERSVLEHPQWDHALHLATSTPSYMDYLTARKSTERAEELLEQQLRDRSDINMTTLAAAGSLCAFILIFVTELLRKDTVAVLACLSAGGTCLYLVGKGIYTWRHERTWSVLVKSIGLAGAAAGSFIAMYLVFQVEWRPWRTIAVVTLSGLMGYLVQKPGAADQLTRTLTLPMLLVNVLREESEEQRARSIWEEQLPDIADAYANYIINMLLGVDAQKYLVEQDANGLRKLYDPKLTVSTSSMARVERSLGRLDGGSIAVAGPRGVGKTTLLRMMSESSDHLIVQVSAPAEYIPKEFLAELFQRFCQAYLRHRGYEAPKALHPNLARRKRVFRLLRDTTTATMRSVISIGLLIFVVWTLVLERQDIIQEAHGTSIEWFNAAVGRLQVWWTEYPVWSKVALLAVAFLFWPGRRKWRSLKWYSEPELVVRAREYLFRLQIDRTVTRAHTIGITMPYGTSGSVNGGSSVKHLPWSLPELVGKLRHFMEDVAKQLQTSNRCVIVTIDEIDRIGTLEQAERFISEIKAVFGIDNCYFLVSVAEDVGTVFGQRALAGRSVFETAFDEVVLVDPLDLNESHLLLQRRVLGFGDAFVYLVHSLSGGLPRELLRCTRRLVEINAELHDQTGQWPVLQELAVALVNEEVLEVLAGARGQMARTVAGADNGYALDLMRVSIHALRRRPPRTPGEVRALLEPLVAIRELASGETPADSGQGMEGDAPQRTLAMVGVFAYFCLTIAEVFSDAYFDAASASDARNDGSLSSFDELAAIRRELSASYASCLASLERFRGHWGLEQLGL